MAIVSISDLRSAIVYPEFSQRWNEASHGLDGLEKALAFAARFGVNAKLWIDDEAEKVVEPEKSSIDFPVPASEPAPE